MDKVEKFCHEIGIKFDPNEIDRVHHSGKFLSGTYSDQL